MQVKKHLRDFYIGGYNLFSKPLNNLYFFYGHYAYLKDESNEFPELIEKLSRYVDFINFEDALEIVERGDFRQIHKPTVCFSFDDGFKECYTHIYPTLMRYGVNACFFVNPNFIDGSAEYVKNFQANQVHITKEPMTKNMLSEMSRNGFVFGSHTSNHTDLSTLEHDDLIDELEGSKEWLEQLLGRECEYFAWPYGTMKQVSKEALKEATKRYKYIFSAIRSESYYCGGNRQIINRDHFEGFWPESHLRFFLSQQKKYE